MFNFFLKKKFGKKISGCFFNIDDLVRDGYLIIDDDFIKKLIRNICIFLMKLLLECLNNDIISIYGGIMNKEKKCIRYVI
ncbi:MAG: hypothetical protein L6V91_02885 [Bacilli bacterium]|nr:MAG: hypothetical protein L6V91_02885 [Bacilli bacterium]